MTQVSIREARNNLSQLIKDAQAGEEVVISNHGDPVARLVPIRRSTGRDVLAALDALPPLANPRSAADIDAEIRAERASWE